jgi:hypothetical protein
MFSTIRVLAVTAATAALFVPTASATQMITDTLAPGGSSGGTHFITDTLAPGGGVGMVVSVPAGGSFNWADAGIGAVVVCALMLLVSIGLQLLARRRRGQLAF